MCCMGQPGDCIKIDGSKLLSDLLKRIESKENLDDILDDLAYGLAAEIHEFICEWEKQLNFYLVAATSSTETVAHKLIRKVISDSVYETKRLIENPIIKEEEKTMTRNQDGSRCHSNTQLLK